MSRLRNNPATIAESKCARTLPFAANSTAAKWSAIAFKTQCRRQLPRGGLVVFDPSASMWRMNRSRSRDIG